jgi:hypothetical protein
MKKPQPSDKITPILPKIPTLATGGGETSVEFNRCMVIYSNNLDGNRPSTWRASMTSISCYMDTQFVGEIKFFQDNIIQPLSFRDPNGVICLYFPVSDFQDILALVNGNKPLYLFFVEKDEQNNPLNPPVGAIATAQQPIGGNA